MRVMRARAACTRNGTVRSGTPACCTVSVALPGVASRKSSARRVGTPASLRHWVPSCNCKLSPRTHAVRGLSASVKVARSPASSSFTPCKAGCRSCAWVHASASGTGGNVTASKPKRPLSVACTAARPESRAMSSEAGSKFSTPVSGSKDRSVSSTSASSVSGKLSTKCQSCQRLSSGKRPRTCQPRRPLPTQLTSRSSGSNSGTRPVNQEGA